MSKRTSIPILEFATLVVVVAGCIIAVVPNADQFAIGLIAKQPVNNVAASSMVAELDVVESPNTPTTDNVDNELAAAFGTAAVESDTDLEQEAVSEQEWPFETAANESPLFDLESKEAPEEQSVTEPVNAMLVSQRTEAEPETLPTDKSQELEDSDFFNESVETSENFDEQVLSDFLEKAEEELGIDNSAPKEISDSVTSTEQVPFFIQPISEDTDAESVMEDFATVIMAKESRSDDNQLRLRLSGAVDVDDRTMMMSQKDEVDTQFQRVEQPDRIASMPSLTRDSQRATTQQPDVGGSTTKSQNQLSSSGWASNPTVVYVDQNEEAEAKPRFIEQSGSQNRFEAGTFQPNWHRVRNNFLDKGIDIPAVMPKSPSAAPAQIRNQHFEPDSDWSMQELPAKKRRTASISELRPTTKGVPSQSAQTANPSTMTRLPASTSAGTPGRSREPMSASSMLQDGEFQYSR